MQHNLVQNVIIFLPMENLKNLRKAKGMSQQELASQINVSQETLSGYERGSREPDYATLQKLANFFNVTVDYLLNAKENDLIIMTKKQYEKMADNFNQLNSVFKEIEHQNNKKIQINDNHGKIEFN